MQALFQVVQAVHAPVPYPAVVKHRTGVMVQLLAPGRARLQQGLGLLGAGFAVAPRQIVQQGRVARQYRAA